MGASTGGPRAVAQVLSGLPRDISMAILVVQHMTAEFVPSFVERLQWGSSLKISLAAEGEPVNSGQVLVAPGGGHTMIVQDGDTKRIQLSSKASPHDVVPCIDRAMRSAAKACGEATLGVLLTGMGSDGAKGMEAIKAAGGSTIAEDPSTCIVFGMPKTAIELGCVDRVVPLPLIAHSILSMI